jgi:hypothetical protein
VLEVILDVILVVYETGIAVACHAVGTLTLIGMGSFQMIYYASDGVLIGKSFFDDPSIGFETVF